MALNELRQPLKISGLTQLAQSKVRSWALDQIFGGLKPNYKQKQCDNIVSPEYLKGS
jgi:hypothetical protein